MNKNVYRRMNIYLQLEKMCNKFFNTEKSRRLKSLLQTYLGAISDTFIYIYTDTFILIHFPIPTYNLITSRNFSVISSIQLKNPRACTSLALR